MIKDLLSFTLNPDRRFITNISTSIKIWRSIVLLVCLVIVQIIIQVIFLSLLGSGHNQGDQITKYDENIVRETSLFFVFFLGPIIEELTYRLALTDFNAQYFRISVSLMIATIIRKIVALSIYEIEIDLTVLEVVLAVIFYLASIKLNLVPIERRWNTIYKGVFWFSLIFFCLIHLPQLFLYRFDFYIISRALISFAIGALFFSYTRVRYGLLYAIGIHCMYNVITISTN